MNPVETIYAAFPAFLHLDSHLAGALLEPLLEFQSTPSILMGMQRLIWVRALHFVWSFGPDRISSYAGSSWPQVKGNNTDQSVYAVESTSLTSLPMTRYLTLFTSAFASERKSSYC